MAKNKYSWFEKMIGVNEKNELQERCSRCRKIFSEGLLAKMTGRERPEGGSGRSL